MCVAIHTVAKLPCEPTGLLNRYFFEREPMMNTVTRLFFCMLLAILAGTIHAQVISVVPDGLGDAGHAGTVDDPLDIGETVGVKVVLEAGYELSSFHLNLEVSGPGTLSWDTMKNGSPNLTSPFSPFGYANLDSDSLDSFTGVAFTPIAGPADVLTGLYITCTGQGSSILDLLINGKSDYRIVGEDPWQEAADGDLADLTLYQPPLPTHALTLNAGAHGSISGDPAGSTFEEGTVVTLTAVPDPGYQVAEWTGTDDDWSVENTNTVTVNADKVVLVTFEVIPPNYYYLSTQVAGEGGTLSPASGLYQEGPVTLTATPEPGYRVASWSGTDDDTSTSNTNTVNLNGGKTVWGDV